MYNEPLSDSQAVLHDNFPLVPRDKEFYEIASLQYFMTWSSTW